MVVFNFAMADDTNHRDAIKMAASWFGKACVKMIAVETESEWIYYYYLFFA